MSTTALISANDGLHAHFIEQSEGAPRRFGGGQVQVLKNHIKIGEAPHKIKVLPLLLKSPGSLCPCSPLLFNVHGLQAGNGLKHTMMTFLGEVPCLTGLLTHGTGEFGEINFHGASYTTTGTTQTRP